MSLRRDMLDELRRDLKHAGYARVDRPYDISRLSRPERVIECETLASKNYFNVLYLQVESNWKAMAQEVALKENRACLVVTAYRKYVILATVKDFKTESAKARYVVLDDPDKQLPKFIKAIGVAPDAQLGAIDDTVQATFDKFSEYKDAIKQFEDSLDKIITKTKNAVSKVAAGNKRYKDAAEQLVDMCRQVINDRIASKDIMDMIVQHVLTYRIFEMVYDEHDFHNTNTVARSLENLKSLLDLDVQADYGTLEIIAESVTDSEQKQEFLKKVYETFYKKYDPKRADREGIVYTPLEVVGFMVNSVEELLCKHFGKGLSDSGVSVLDPAAGTGTFPAQILRKINPEKIDKKYTNELFANEIYVLPYYIAALNVENTYYEITGRRREFDNVCWVDTLESGALDFGKLVAYFEDVNVERVSRQQRSPINVVIGNPPYSAGQHNYDEENKNFEYKYLDKKIEETYVKALRKLDPNITNIKSNYDSYIRFFRWASDRIGESGIVAFVTNAGFVRSNAGAGMRKCLVEEFTDIWCFDLRGNARTKGKIRKKEAGNVFGSGSRTPIAITLLVKNPKESECAIHYRDIGDYLSREEKLNIVKNAVSIGELDGWQQIAPDKYHDWIEQRREEFYQYLPMGSKDAKSGKGNALFGVYSRGVVTGRDAWACNSSKNELEKNMKIHVEYCLKRDKAAAKLDPKRGRKWNKLLKEKHDRTRGKWDDELITRMARERPKFDKAKIRTSLYRPFFKQHLYFDYHFNNRYRIPELFPDDDSVNTVICIPYKFSGELSAIVTNITPSLGIIGANQCFPLYKYEDGKRCENISDNALAEYKEKYSDKKITKNNIFHYVYGILHHHGYKSEYANNLLREFPRIPMAPDFWGFADAGRDLTALHVRFDSCPRYDLGTPKCRFNKFEKLSFPKKKIAVIDGRGKEKQLEVYDESRLRVDGQILFEDIPEIKYTVNGRTPLAWVVDQYATKTDKPSGITNDPCTGTDIVAIIERAVYLGLESDRLVARLPDEFE